MTFVFNSIEIEPKISWSQKLKMGWFISKGTDFFSKQCLYTHYAYPFVGAYYYTVKSKGRLNIINLNFFEQS